MASYCVNKNVQANGDHEVHNLDAACPYTPAPANRVVLGAHATCGAAVLQAKRTYPKSNGCAHCARACHTS